MSKQDFSKSANQVKLQHLLQGQTFYLCDEEKHDLSSLTASEFDAWALQFVEEITNIKRDLWDVFARWRFLNWLLEEGDITLQQEENGTIVLRKAEVFSSVFEHELEEKTSA